MVQETRRIIDELETFTEDIIRRLATGIHRELTRTTPVDTGWARANWIPQLGVPFIGNSQEIEPTPADVAGAQGLQNAGLAAVVGYRLELGAVFISNNVPYILELNDGSSTQAPPMFIETSIEVGINDVLQNLDQRFSGL